MGKKANDLIGQKFGRLTVVERVGSDKYGHSKWLCHCECGNNNFITVGQSLIKGLTQSCGCLHKEELSKIRTKHGMSGTRIYTIWKAMHQRCENKNCINHGSYYDKNIKVCEEWSGNNGAKNFINWAMNNGYEDNLTIDRINSNGNYEPSNCRWANRIIQNNNTNKNFNITFNNETHSIAEWSRLLNIPYTTLHRRINSLNWDTEKALTTPIRIIKKRGV